MDRSPISTPCNVYLDGVFTRLCQLVGARRWRRSAFLLGRLVAKALANALAEHNGLGPMSGEEEAVLLVEDEPAVRRQVSDLLQSRGY